MLAQSQYNLDLKDFNDENPLYESILPLRCLLLQGREDSKWSTLMALESHDDLRRGGELWNYEQVRNCYHFDLFYTHKSVANHENFLPLFI